ncbi:MAG: pimelyl-ACP methyl ester esterase BioV [Thiovulaceae bacterium]|nr:pimelyl-ACP methyl ester esterase BioV [Sulfurimonadaceae bacterium]
MIFYSGFALVYDDRLFEEHLKDDVYTVAGFSLGAIKAFEYALKAKTRIDTLQLFSPAFFQTKNERFKTMQLGAFSADEKMYLRTFVDNCFFPAPNDGSIEMGQANYHDLKYLLEYEWDSAKLKELAKKGITIEVYLGGKDKIIDAKAAFDFFAPLSVTFLYKEAGHFLKTK